MDGPWSAIAKDFSDLQDVARLLQVAVRMAMAAVLGGILGWQRQRAGKEAGVRTHMLVGLGTTVFVLVAELENFDDEALSRVVQGVAAGVGFLGGGTILKLPQARRIEGLTTAAGIWLTAAIGVAVGNGRLGSALIATLLAWAILELVHLVETRVSRPAAMPPAEVPARETSPPPSSPQS